MRSLIRRIGNGWKILYLLALCVCWFSIYYHNELELSGVTEDLQSGKSVQFTSRFSANIEVLVTKDGGDGEIIANSCHPFRLGIRKSDDGKFDEKAVSSKPKAEEYGHCETVHEVKTSPKAGYIYSVLSASNGVIDEVVVSAKGANVKAQNDTFHGINPGGVFLCIILLLVWSLSPMIIQILF